MAVTDCVVLKEMGLDRLNQVLAEAVADGYAPQAGVLVIQGGWYGMVMVKDSSAAVTGCKVVSADGFERLDDAIKEGVTDGYAPYSRIIQSESDDWLITLVQGTLPGGGGGGEVSVAWADVSGKPAVIAAGDDAAAARAAIGAGTSNLTIGTTSTTAKAGDYKPVVADLTDSSAAGRAAMKAAVIAAGADAAAARTAIGAGVGNSNLVIGTTGTQAKAGNWKPTAADVTDAGAFGRQLLQAADQAAAKTLLGIS